MKNKIIIGLSSFIFLLLLLFQTYRLKIERKERKEAENKLELIIKQNELNEQDKIKQNEEIKKAHEKNNNLQKQIKILFKVDSCVNTRIDDRFIGLLQDNNGY